MSGERSWWWRATHEARFGVPLLLLAAVVGLLVGWGIDRLTSGL